MQPKAREKEPFRFIPGLGASFLPAKFFNSQCFIPPAEQFRISPRKKQNIGGGGREIAVVLGCLGPFRGGTANVALGVGQLRISGHSGWIRDGPAGFGVCWKSEVVNPRLISPAWLKELSLFPF